MMTFKHIEAISPAMERAVKGACEHEDGLICEKREAVPGSWWVRTAGKHIGNYWVVADVNITDTDEAEIERLLAAAKDLVRVKYSAV
jgi:hypothetical protein